MLVTFPLGVSEFIDRSGNIYRPDSNRQVEAPAVFLGDFLQAGFAPAELVAALISLAGDIATLTGRVDDHDTQMALIEGILNGDLDLVFVVSPATLNTPATAAAWQRTVTVSLKTSAGELHSWFNGTIADGVSLADTSLAGTASLVSNDLVFVSGVAEVVINGDAQDWLADETDTLTVAAATILGHAVAEQTSVETFTGE